jgi:hypothetical protein
MASRKIRVRSKRLEQISADRLALALWLMARDIADGKDRDAKSPAQPDEDQAPREENA